MARTVAIGIQDFEQIIERNVFYIDKTGFIRDWWESEDSVTLITRPRRFGKTLTMSMLDYFFSVDNKGKETLFHDLDIWKDEKYRELQGSVPVIFVSFASVKSMDYQSARIHMNQLLVDLYEKYRLILESDILSEREKAYADSIRDDMDDATAAVALNRLSRFLSRYYRKKVIILLDEYDTPMQEAYVCGYWEQMTGFIRTMFNATFKTNPYMFRAVMTGITGISKESIFSDLNNLKVVTTTSEKYAAVFGFTEEEVFAAMDEQGISETEKALVKTWYDGFCFGRVTDIYNPWSIINYLDKKQINIYWANTSSNSLAGLLIRKGSVEIKESFEDLLHGKTIDAYIDEEIVFGQLKTKRDVIWSLLLASGYMKPVRVVDHGNDSQSGLYTLSLTNKEVRWMFQDMVSDWFGSIHYEYNGFIKALLRADLEEMNIYMNKVALSTFSSFDSGTRPSGQEPERFYHGFVLGLLVDLRDRYEVLSNRESGYGRYDVMLKPKENGLDGIVIEFKVYNPVKEKDLSETVQNALKQIKDRKYVQTLIDAGIPEERIRTYGFAFEGTNVLIG